jgi:hypothetical protein
VNSKLVKQSEADARIQGNQLKDFKYICVGYSMHFNNKNKTEEQSEDQVGLPFCVGIEVPFFRNLFSIYVLQVSKLILFQWDFFVWSVVHFPSLRHLHLISVFSFNLSSIFVFQILADKRSNPNYASAHANRDGIKFVSFILYLCLV